MLGELRAVHGAYRADDLVVAATGDTAAALARALTRVADRRRVPRPHLDRGRAERIARGRGRAVGPGTRTATWRPTATARSPRSPTGTPSRSRYRPARPPSCGPCSRLRDAVTGLLDAEAASLDDTPELDRLRQDLNQRYDAYVAGLRADQPVLLAAHRPHRPRRPASEKLARIRPPQGGFRADPFAPLVYALEEFDPVSQTAAKAAIFTGRVVAPRTPRLGADTPADALAICLDTHGEVRLTEIARLLGTSEDAGPRRSSARWSSTTRNRAAGPGRRVPVRQRPRQARRGRTAAADDPRFAVNVAALRKVIPPDLRPARSTPGSAPPGSTPPTSSSSSPRSSTTHASRSSIPAARSGPSAASRHSVLATSTWGTGRYPAPQLAQALLEQRRIEVRDKIADGDRVLNLDADPGRAGEGRRAGRAVRRMGLGGPRPRRRSWPRTYNQLFNNLVLRTYDDAQLSLPGLALTFQPRPHQVAAVARIIAEPAVGLFHEVGAGKTAEMIMGAMELRRLGLARKPAIVVPNHMLEQFSPRVPPALPAGQGPGRPARGPARPTGAASSSPAAPPATGTRSS